MVVRTAGAVFACSLGGCGIGWLIDGCRLRQLVAEANYGVSSRAGVHYRARTCCGRVILVLVCVPILFSVFVIRAPGVIRRFDPLGCGFESDPYRVLGVSHGATPAEVKRAYRTLSKEHHPDRNPGCGESCVEKMAALNAAKETIDSRGGGSFEDGDDIAEQWTEILECFSRGGGPQGSKPATREREPFHTSAGRSAGSAEDCSFVCPVGVCNSPEDASKPECEECALCHQRGGSRRKKAKTKKKSGKSSTTKAAREKQKREKQKAKERKRAAAAKEESQKKNRKRAAAKNKRKKQQAQKAQKFAQVESKTTDHSWGVLTTAQRRQEITAAALSFWTMAVNKVRDSTPAAQQFSVSVWRWAFFLRKCGLEQARVGAVALTLLGGEEPNGAWQGTTLAAFLAFTSEAHVRAVVTKHMLEEADAAFLLKGFRIMQHLTAVLAEVKMDRSTVLGYAKKVAPLLGMEKDDVIPLTDAAKDGWGVQTPWHRVELDITSALLAVEASAAGSRGDGGDGVSRDIEEEMARLRSFLELDDDAGEL